MRLVDLFRQLNGVLDRYAPDEAAEPESTPPIPYEHEGPDEHSENLEQDIDE